MKRLLLGGVLAVLAFTAILVLALSAGGGSGGRSASERTIEKKAAIYDISQIERSFHEAVSKKNIDEMVGLFAPHATGTFGPGKTVTGKEQIRNVWLKSKAWESGTHWLSDHPAYKLAVTVDGDRGTLHFECHFIDVDTGKIAALTAGNLDVAKIDGKWLITNSAASSPSLTQ
jgi:ketosteroid isomerase-like protein